MIPVAKPLIGDEHGIGTGVYYPVPSHLSPSFHRLQDLPETEHAAREVLSLPVPAGDLTAIIPVTAAGS